MKNMKNAFKRIAAWLKKMNHDQVLKVAECVGIYTKSGHLTKRYQENETTINKLCSQTDRDLPKLKKNI